MRVRGLVPLLVAVAASLVPQTASAAVPSNDDRADATEIASLPATHKQLTTDATLEALEPQPCGSIAATVWFRFTATDDGVLVADTSGSDFDTVLAAYPSGGPTSVACNDDTGGAFTSEISFAVLAGQTYQIQAGGWEGETGKLVLNVATDDDGGPSIPNDDRANATPIDTIPGSLQQSTLGATTEPGESSPCAVIGATVWFRLTVPDTGVLVIDTFGSDFDTVLGIYPEGGSTSLTCNDDAGSFQSEVRLFVQPGQALDVQAGGYTRFFEPPADGNLVLNVRVDPPVEGDLFGDAITISPPMFEHETETEFATKEAGEPDPQGVMCAALFDSSVDRTIWYRFQPETGGAFLAHTQGSDYDTVVAVYEQVDAGAGFDGLEELVCNDETATPQSATVAVPVLPGRTYYVQVGGWFGDYGNLRFSFAGS